MVRKVLSDLCDFILAKNPYLIKGYCNVTKDASTGLIWTDRTSEDHFIVFPNDRLGTYFYIRNESTMNFAVNPETSVSNCFSGATDFQVPLRMVVSMDNADPYILIQNIVNTLAQFGQRMTFTSAEWNRTRIITTEMDGATQSDIQAALQRANQYTLVSFSFIAVLPIEFMLTKCFLNPCIQC